MKKYLFLMLPLVAILFSACSEGYSLEKIEAYYVTNEDKILDANGETITIMVASTHSYVMKSEPSDACSFLRNGVVTYSQEGVAIMEVEHEVGINPNTTGQGREVIITATHRHNPEIITSLLFYQPAQTEEEE